MLKNEFNCIHMLRSLASRKGSLHKKGPNHEFGLGDRCVR